MMSFRTTIVRARSGDVATDIGFRFGPEGFVATVDADGIAIRRADPSSAAVVLTTGPMTLASVVDGRRPIADAAGAGVLRLDGDRALADRFVTLFPLPAKIS